MAYKKSSKKNASLVYRIRKIFHENPLIAFLELLLIVGALVFAVRQSSAVTSCSVSDTARNAITSTPLIDLGSETYMRLTSLGPPEVYSATPPQVIGGLYPGGVNTPPPAHHTAGLSIASQITNLDSAGDNDPNGKIGFVSIGMSNTKKEFEKFIRTRNLVTNYNPSVILVNGAQTNVSAEYWRDPTHVAWSNLLSLVNNKNLSANQVQVAWVKLAESGSGDFPAKPEALESDLSAVVRNLKTYFPNIKIAFLSSRTHSYKFFEGLSPDPTAFETAFAVRWLIEDQISGDPSLNYDSGQGTVVAPILFWGPYLWADVHARSDGFTWMPEDLVSDCTHPNDSGSAKVASLLRGFFGGSELATPWFLKSAGPTPTSGPSPTPGLSSPTPTSGGRATNTPAPGSPTPTPNR